MGYKWNNTICYTNVLLGATRNRNWSRSKVIDSITKHVSGRDAEQELVSTVSRARRGTGTGISDLFTGQKKPSQSREVKRFLKNELPVPSRRSCMILLRTRSRLNASMLKSRSMPISPARWILLSESIALSISDIIVEGFM